MWVWQLGVQRLRQTSADKVSFSCDDWIVVLKALMLKCLTRMLRQG